MPAARPPENETARLLALKSYEILDTACEESFDRLVSIAARLTNSPIALISLIDQDRQWLKARYGVDVQETPREVAFCAHAILDPHEPLVVPDATRDRRFADNPMVTGPFNLRSYAGIPLVDQDGHALGTLCVLDREPREITAETIDILKSLAYAVLTMLQLRRALRQVGTLALTDPLTGMANRTAFMHSLDQAIARQARDGSLFSILYLDLDGLKRVNDTLGHAIGDNVLRGAADALRDAVRKEDTPARLGGDEFGVVLVGGDGSEALNAAERARAAIECYMRDNGWPVTASVGGAAFEEPPHSADAALAAVDQLMYQAKTSGRNRVVSRWVGREAALVGADDIHAGCMP